jgi:hypothetical protein
MNRSGCLTLLAALAVASPARPADPSRFQWQVGQVLTYRVEQSTTASETENGQTTETSTKMSLVKRWQVVAVDPAGVANLQMSLASLRLETKKPDGESVVFDSAKPDPANAQMQQYVGPALALLRLDAQGRLVEVKESKFGPASNFVKDLPFKLTLPDGALAAGQSWERTYAIKLDPPQGIGESYDAVQKYACKSVEGGAAVIAMTTELKTKPSTPADQIPLLIHMPQGEVVFDLTTGRMRSAKMSVQQELNEHRGAGSKYRFSSSYTEEAVEGR